MIATTIHDESSRQVVQGVGRRRHQVNKPKAVLEYNSYMGGVDRVDQMIQTYDVVRKSLKWYRKIVIHLLQIAMMNAWIIYVKEVDRNMTFLKFQRVVVSSLVFEGNEEHGPAPQENVVRLTARHFPSHVPATERKQKAQRRCRVCRIRLGIRKESRFCCLKCPSQPGLCLENCFEIYHTVANIRPEQN